MIEILYVYKNKFYSAQLKINDNNIIALPDDIEEVGDGIWILLKTNDGFDIINKKWRYKVNVVVVEENNPDDGYYVYINYDATTYVSNKMQDYYVLDNLSKYSWDIKMIPEFNSNWLSDSFTQITPTSILKWQKWDNYSKMKILDDVEDDVKELNIYTLAYHNSKLYIVDRYLNKYKNTETSEIIYLSPDYNFYNFLNSQCFFKNKKIKPYYLNINSLEFTPWEQKEVKIIDDLPLRTRWLEYVHYDAYRNNKKYIFYDNKIYYISSYAEDKYTLKSNELLSFTKKADLYKLPDSIIILSKEWWKYNFLIEYDYKTFEKKVISKLASDINIFNDKFRRAERGRESDNSEKEHIILLEDSVYDQYLKCNEGKCKIFEVKWWDKDGTYYILIDWKIWDWYTRSNRFSVFLVYKNKS